MHDRKPVPDGVLEKLLDDITGVGPKRTAMEAVRNANAKVRKLLIEPGYDMDSVCDALAHLEEAERTLGEIEEKN